MGKKPAQQEPKPSLETLEVRVRALQEMAGSIAERLHEINATIDATINDINTLRIEEAMRSAK